MSEPTDTKEESCLDMLVDMANQNRFMVQEAREKNGQIKQLQRAVGYVVDTAVPLPDGNGAYIISAKSLADLNKLLSVSVND